MPSTYSELDNSEQNRTKTCTTEEYEHAFKDFKKAFKYQTKIKRTITQLIQVEKKEKNLNPFKNFMDVLATITKSGTTCSEEAKEAYRFLKECSNTVPIFCNKLTFPLSEAENCIKKSKFAKYLKCATKNYPSLCDCYKENGSGVPDSICEAIVDVAKKVTAARKLCMDSTVNGTYINCMQFIKTTLPKILEKCFASSNKIIF